MHTYDKLCDLCMPPTAAQPCLPRHNHAIALVLRQRALKELNERLSRMDNPTSSWPSLEDGPSDTEAATTPTGGVASEEGGGSVAVDMEADPPPSGLAREGSSATVLQGTVQTV